MNLRNLIIIIVVALVAVGGVFYFLSMQETGPSKYDDFAKCLKDKGVLFYGAFWCQHCQVQKSMFGSAKQYLPYVECSTPDGNGRLQACIDQAITTYPTWVYPDQSRTVGEVNLDQLAEKSGCELPK